MKFSQSIIALAAAGIVSSSPLAKRAGPTDGKPNTNLTQ